jgi:hypothetical protein
VTCSLASQPAEAGSNYQYAISSFEASEYERCPRKDCEESQFYSCIWHAIQRLNLTSIAKDAYGLDQRYKEPAQGASQSAASRLSEYLHPHDRRHVPCFAQNILLTWFHYRDYVSALFSCMVHDHLLQIPQSIPGPKFLFGHCGPIVRLDRC